MNEEKKIKLDDKLERIKEKFIEKNYVSIWDDNDKGLSFKVAKKEWDPALWNENDFQESNKWAHNSLWIKKVAEKYICELAWWAQKKLNKKRNLLEQNYKDTIKVLIDVCKSHKWEINEASPWGNKKSDQTGIRIKIAEFSNENVENFVDDIVEWEEQNMTSFLDIQQRILDEQGLIREKQMKEYINLLLNNHNIILHGAPGTGKTYLAKDIAQMLIFGKVKKEEDWTDLEKAAFNNQYCFVQFHQSYDYTDFVEGLRPINKEGSSDIGFKRTDGIFKIFCGNALTTDSLENAYNDLIDKIREKKVTSFNQKTDTPILIKEISKQNNIVLHSENEAKNNESKMQYEITYDNLKKIHAKYNTPKLLDEIKNIKDDIRNCISEADASSAWVNSSAYWAVAKYLSNELAKNYVFVIDEINRGEMSKIFGELFFSIDPGYRGVKGKIKTQYANLNNKPNKFDKALGITENGNNSNYGHFFVPENVYIIGTMNDIDRSVESMDFAMRRRFAFIDVTADNRKEMLSDKDNGLGEFANEALSRMQNLNMAIETIPGLSSAYHIGPAYFLKLKKNGNDFEKLWTNHIEGVLREYLRGMDNAENLRKELKRAYDKDDEYEYNDGKPRKKPNTKTQPAAVKSGDGKGDGEQPSGEPN